MVIKVKNNVKVFKKKLPDVYRSVILMLHQQNLFNAVDVQHLFFFLTNNMYLLFFRASFDDNNFCNRLICRAHWRLHFVHKNTFPGSHTEYRMRIKIEYTYISTVY